VHSGLVHLQRVRQCVRQAVSDGGIVSAHSDSLLVSALRWRERAGQSPAVGFLLGVCVCIYIYMCVYVCMCVCVYVCMYVCVYMHVCECECECEYFEMCVMSAE
jgi:hypothetical protein